MTKTIKLAIESTLSFVVEENKGVDVVYQDEVLNPIHELTFIEQFTLNSEGTVDIDDVKRVVEDKWLNGIAIRSEFDYLKGLDYNMNISIDKTYTIH